MGFCPVLKTLSEANLREKVSQIELPFLLWLAMLYEQMQPSGYQAGYLPNPSLWSWEQSPIALCGPLQMPNLQRPKRASGEEWDVLAPLKKLRLSEIPNFEAEADMAVDADAESRMTRQPSGSPNAMKLDSDGETIDPPPETKDKDAQERRARIQQRAWEEMRRYRQALRNCESGMMIRDCA